jgi:cold shock CspA family protein
MIRGKITSWKDDRYFGFITSETHKTGIFVHGREIALDQGEMPSVGMIVEYLHDTDRLGRERAVNVKVIRDGPMSDGPARGACTRRGSSRQAAG